MDYFIELSDLGRKIDTVEIKKIFHDTLVETSAAHSASNREAKSTDLDDIEEKISEKLTLGSFIVDPYYTDFVGMLKIV